jgi:hypothetical protein
LGKVLALSCEGESGQPCAGERSTGSDRNSVQKIPAGDGAVHAEFPVTGAIGLIIVRPALIHSPIIH